VIQRGVPLSYGLRYHLVAKDGTGQMEFELPLICAWRLVAARFNISHDTLPDIIDAHTSSTITITDDRWYYHDIITELIQKNPCMMLQKLNSY
jgi:hypothetical protein